jgi:ParB-like chromosome segregation protein Spo0J
MANYHTFGFFPSKEIFIPIQSIDEYAFNPRQADNDHFEDIKNSIKKIGLQQRFSS